MGICRWRVLLAIIAATVAATSQHQTLSYEEAVSLAVDFYNQRPNGARVFRLLKAEPQPGWDMTSQSRQELNFTVQETECLASENRRVEECDFKENGLVQDCSGFFSTERACPTVIINCDTVAPEEMRATTQPTFSRCGPPPNQPSPDTGHHHPTN
uniref:Vipericidin n=1 Tax=Sphenodon punctatus TaxID=8508 RepID=A0A8D0H531_SPHPU